MTKIKKLIILISLVSLLLFSCENLNQEQDNLKEEISYESEYQYPPPVNDNANEGSIYPAPETFSSNGSILPADNILPFKIYSPVTNKDFSVSGEGPSGIDILVVDITLSGEILGSGTINKNNTFSIKLPKSPEANHLIGITLGNPRPDDDWEALWLLRNTNAMSLPQVGIFFDSVLVSE